jgi:DNA mismatch endonuclease, patch repair protein
MGDSFDIEKRSEIMRAVKSDRNKSTELKLIEYFKLYNIHGWRRKQNLVGHPDFVFLKSKLAIFVDGCFWHGHGCRNISPSTNASYWRNKIKKNVERDKTINKLLRSRKWTVIRIWECDLNNRKLPAKIKAIKKALS